MELEKYIKKTKEIINDGYVGIERALMKKDETLENLKNNTDQYSEKGYTQKWEEVIETYNEEVAAVTAKCRTAIQEQKDGYMKEVSTFYDPDGSKIDLNDMNLIKAGFELSPDEFIGLIKKYIDNSTMLRVIEKYAVENKMLSKIRDKDSKRLIK